MPQSTFVVAYDGHDQNVLDAAIRLAKMQSAGIHVVHVIEWSPFKMLTPEELADRHKQRQAEIAHADQNVLRPALAKIIALGIAADGESRHGDVKDTISEVATAKSADLIFVGRSRSLSDRVFGSVASGLAQTSTLPVVIIP
jgi:nucleotide-binding universal stress UspA family protein